MSNGKVRTAEENYGKRKHFSEIEEKENEYFDRVWYVRHKYLEAAGRFDDCPEDIKNGAFEAAKKVESKYDKDDLQESCESSWEYGRISGWLECLRWCLGLELEGLDT